MGDVDLRRSRERLINNAIAFGKFKQRGQLFFARIGIEIEMQSDFLKADRRFFGNGECASKIEIALGANGCVA